MWQKYSWAGRTTTEKQSFIILELIKFKIKKNQNNKSYFSNNFQGTKHKYISTYVNWYQMSWCAGLLFHSSLKRWWWCSRKCWGRYHRKAHQPPRNCWQELRLYSRSGNGLKFKADLQLVAETVALVSPDIQTVAAIEESCAIGNVYSIVVYRSSVARGVPNSSAKTQRYIWATTLVAVPVDIVSNWNKCIIAMKFLYISTEI